MSDASSHVHFLVGMQTLAIVANTTVAVRQRCLSSIDEGLDHRRKILPMKGKTPSHVDNGVALRMSHSLMGGINHNPHHPVIGIGSSKHGMMTGNRNALVMSVSLKWWKVSEKLVQK